VTDGQTDGQTDGIRISVVAICWPCDKKWKSCKRDKVIVNIANRCQLCK